MAVTLRRAAGFLPGLGAFVGLLLPSLSAANDSIAELGIGGLVLGRSDAIRMAKEDLFISMDEVRVDYVFRNESDEDITTLVAFPLPDMSMDASDFPALPQDAADGFLDFKVSIDGVDIKPDLQQRAVFRGLDITDKLTAAGLLPDAASPAGVTALEAASGSALDELVMLGAVNAYAYDGKMVHEAAWTMTAAYHWTATFPAKADVVVKHRYRPSVGGTAGIWFVPGGSADDAMLKDYTTRYCMDDAFLKAVAKRVAGQGENGPWVTESRVEYVLTTGANWMGAIGEFSLTVDKGSPDNLVSFCGEGVTKTGPTTFRMEARDFWPEKDLGILFVVTEPR